ncbi:Lrp/AsnC family transcriptional regulator [Candidatus Woesearchaeota archaeon]|nr:Lrp/AsnC family transcriptional regulator [Candidatus Woesearchaeota archaeon]
MDETDLKILNALKENSKRSVRDISKITGIPSTTIHSRISRLKREGIIRRYTIDVDMEKLGRVTTAYVMLLLNPQAFRKIKHPENEVTDELLKYPIVEEAATITGNRDAIIKIRAKDINELDEFIVDLRSKDMIVRTETQVVLHEGRKSPKFDGVLVESNILNTQQARKAK